MSRTGGPIRWSGTWSGRTSPTPRRPGSSRSAPASWPRRTVARRGSDRPPVATRSPRCCAAGKHVALVSSGAVGAGIGRLGLTEAPDRPPHASRPPPPPARRYLIRAYDDAFRRHGRTRRPVPADPRRLRRPHPLPQRPQHPADPLRVRLDPDHQRERHGQRRRNPVRRQRLARRPGGQLLLAAPLLLILSVVDGLLTGDRTPPRATRRPSRSGSSGISTRRSAGTSARAGAPWAPAGCGASSRPPGWSPGPAARSSSPRAAETDPITQVLDGRAGRHADAAVGATQQARRRWIGSTARPRGYLVVDDGARTPWRAGRGSLLAIGIVEVLGRILEGGRRRRPRPRRRRIRPRPDELCHRRGQEIRGLRTDQIAARPSARPPTTR